MHISLVALEVLSEQDNNENNLPNRRDLNSPCLTQTQPTGISICFRLE